MYNINISKLRKDLLEYLGVAMLGTFPQALVDYSDVENADDEELVQIAQRFGFKIQDYFI